MPNCLLPLYSHVFSSFQIRYGGSGERAQIMFTFKIYLGSNFVDMGLVHHFEGTIDWLYRDGKYDKQISMLEKLIPLQPLLWWEGKSDIWKKGNSRQNVRFGLHSFALWLMMSMCTYVCIVVKVWRGMRGQQTGSLFISQKLLVWSMVKVEKDI